MEIPQMYGNAIPPETASGQLQKIYQKSEALLGGVPPHVQLHATYFPEDMEHYFQMMELTRTHPDIPLEWFALLRLKVSRHEGFPYCERLNDGMLRSMGYDEQQIAAFFARETDKPLNSRLRLLYDKALKSIYDSGSFDQKDFDELNRTGFPDRTVYQALHYATWYLGTARRLDTYRIKESDPSK